MVTRDGQQGKPVREEREAAAPGMGTGNKSPTSLRLLGVLAAVLLAAVSCTLPQHKKHPPFALEYQGRGWSFKHPQREKRIDCDVPPTRVQPGPYPYVFRVPRKARYYLLVSLVISSPAPGRGNRVDVVVDGKTVYAYRVEGSAQGGDRIEIMPENPAVFKLGMLDAGMHTLTFPAASPENRYVVHWGVADENAIQAFWKRREIWLRRPL